MLAPHRKILDRCSRESFCLAVLWLPLLAVAQKGPPVQMFLGNLAFTVTEQDVRELFAPYGEVERITLMTDRETGHPRGFGFVEMADDTVAQAAIAALHGYELVGRAFNVNTARPRDERCPSGGGRRW
jgi:RNA recognition motif-containing protein